MSSMSLNDTMTMMTRTLYQMVPKRLVVTYLALLETFFSWKSKK